MKQLSIEQKAKAYDEAKLRMSAAYNSNRCTIGFMNEIFPELEEDDDSDEKVRKALIKLVTNHASMDLFIDYDIHLYEALAWLKKQDKKNPANKVEPKFKVGDWVMLDRPVLITKVKDMPYNIHEYWTSEGTWFGSAAKAKLWTIQDAKDGDVLAAEDKIFLYNGKLDLRGRVCAYCGIYKTYDGLRFTECAIGNYFTCKEPHPATKEQRDLLFQKMKEAGYEWDEDKKELRKIEQKSAWNEKIKGLNELETYILSLVPDMPLDAIKVDARNIRYIINKEQKPTNNIEPSAFKDKLLELFQKFRYIKEGILTNGDIIDYVDAHIQELIDTMQKPTKWSEEDEKRLDNVIIQLQAASHIIFEDEVNDSITFIKSLKDRVQPKQEWNEEDNEKIDELIALCEGRKKLCSSTVPAYKRMDELKEWLESFRPQNWTKEDKKRYESCLQRLGTGNPEQPETSNSKWFKEHVYPKSQSIWKPSEKQMEVLLSVVIKGCHNQTVLESLYQDLKKLKG